MAEIVQYSRLQQRVGLFRELPTALNEAEFGWTLDTRQLFIGNGPIHPGNTEIITQHTPASSLNYSYKSPTAYQQLLLNGAAVGVTPYMANTGFLTYVDNNNIVQNDLVPSNFNPAVRSYQEKFDEIASVKDYEAVGDGRADDTGPLTRAVLDLYSQQSGTVDVSNPDYIRRSMAIYFPEGVYRIRRHILALPGVTLIGVPGKTIIFLDTELAIDNNDDAVMVTADSLGQSDGLMGQDNGDGVPVISHCDTIRFYGIIFQSNQAASADVSKRQIVRLARASNVRFEKCEFNFVGSSVWQTSDGAIDAPVGVLVTKFNDATNTALSNYTFKDCKTSGCAYDINFIDAVTNVLIDGSTFNGGVTPIKIGFDATVDVSGLYRTPSSSDSSTRMVISNSTFNNYTQYAIDVLNSSEYIQSMNNYFTGGNGGYSGTNPSIHFGPSTKFCSSIGDVFTVVTDSVCGTANPRVFNESSFNTIFNAQDYTVIPYGIKDLTVCGSLTVLGNFNIVPGTTVGLDVVTIAYPNATANQPNPYRGNSVVVDYAVRIPNPASNILRTGTFKLIYTESAPGISGVMQYSDEYLEVGGTAPEVQLTAVFDDAAQNVIIRMVSPTYTPTVKYTVQAFSI